MLFLPHNAPLINNCAACSASAWGSAQNVRSMKLPIVCVIYIAVAAFITLAADGQPSIPQELPEELPVISDAEDAVVPEVPEIPPAILLAEEPLPWQGMDSSARAHAADEVSVSPFSCRCVFALFDTIAAQTNYPIYSSLCRMHVRPRSRLTAPQRRPAMPKKRWMQSRLASPQQSRKPRMNPNAPNYSPDAPCSES